MKRWILGVLVGLNQLANVLTGGDPDMTLSARAGLARDEGSNAARGWCKVLHAVDWNGGNIGGLDHCATAALLHQRRVFEEYKKRFDTQEESDAQSTR